MGYLNISGDLTGSLDISEGVVGYLVISPRVTVETVHFLRSFQG